MSDKPPSKFAVPDYSAELAAVHRVSTPEARKAALYTAVGLKKMLGTVADYEYMTLGEEDSPTLASIFTAEEMKKSMGIDFAIPGSEATSITVQVRQSSDVRERSDAELAARLRAKRGEPEIIERSPWQGQPSSQPRFDQSPYFPNIAATLNQIDNMVKAPWVPHVDNAWKRYLPAKGTAAHVAASRIHREIGSAAAQLIEEAPSTAPPHLSPMLIAGLSFEQKPASFNKDSRSHEVRWYAGGELCIALNLISYLQLITAGEEDRMQYENCIRTHTGRNVSFKATLIDASKLRMWAHSASPVATIWGTPGDDMVTNYESFKQQFTMYI